MHPALSVIFLTTLIGAGQGFFLALYTGQVYSLGNLLPAQSSLTFYAYGSLIALALLAGGLLASFFHLGHPERAWRAASQWRTSWLSREVIILPLFMGLVLVYGALHYFGLTRPVFRLGQAVVVDLSLLVGGLASAAAFLLYLSTAMIYASLRFLQEWYSPLTVANYTLLGLASGFTLAAAFCAWSGSELVLFYTSEALLLTLIAFLVRGLSLLRNRRIRHKSTLQTAIGVRHTRIEQKAQGAMGGSFNTREFFHGRSRAAMRTLKYLFLVLVFGLPLLLLGAGLAVDSLWLPAAAFLIQYAGLLLERFYFFADSRHPQNLYYQYIS